ncbi:MAG: serine protease [Acidobacteriota bacterium]
MPQRRKTTETTRRSLYGASRAISRYAREELGLLIPFHVYIQDPLVAEDDPRFGFDTEYLVRWEPGLADGPTSARFAVVDFSADTGTLAPKAVWNARRECFEDPEGTRLDSETADSLQFHQLNVWALLQRALEFFESGSALGRTLPFGFEGNRLIVVPHAGYGQNAYYDRASKSLQFYSFDTEQGRVHTCLSADIVFHEFGHAVLDGVRPRLIESAQLETGAFHEFVADFTAILLVLRNKRFRKNLAKDTDGDLSQADQLSSIAEQFGEAVTGNPFLRSATDPSTMEDVAESSVPHTISQVLTGALWEILVELGRRYAAGRRSPAEAFSHVIHRMQRMAIQPLDLLPPVDVTFRDYALAVLRTEKLANPTDPNDYCDLMFEIFQRRGILGPDDAVADDYLYDRPDWRHDRPVWMLSGSPEASYAFLHDNREQLFIPAEQDVVVEALYETRKTGREGGRQPRQIVLQYLWRERVLLDGGRFGEYAGRATEMLCGGTLVFDELGNLEWWTRKPGTTGGDGEEWEAEQAEGLARRERLLDKLAERIGRGHVGVALGGRHGLFGEQVPLLSVSDDGGVLRFSLSPHMSLSLQDEVYEGGGQWQASS